LPILLEIPGKTGSVCYTIGGVCSFPVVEYGDLTSLKKTNGSRKRRRSKRKNW